MNTVQPKQIRGGFPANDSNHVCSIDADGRTEPKRERTHLDRLANIERRRVARERKRRDDLSQVVAVLDDLGEYSPPAARTLDAVADFFGVTAARLKELLSEHSEEFATDGWVPQNPHRSDDADLWPDRAVVRAALLLDDSTSAVHIRYLLGAEEFPVFYEGGRRHVSHCQALHAMALDIVGHTHDYDPDDLWRDLLETERYDLMGLVVTLAALVPYDQPNLADWLKTIAPVGRTGNPIHKGLATLVPARSPLYGRRGRPKRRTRIQQEAERCVPPTLGGKAVGQE